ncbi:MAG: NAD(P)H-hydrate dehydratase [Lachnospiraceae bacterium]
MKYLLTAAAMKQGDEKTIQKYQMPSMVLMERAALQTIRVMEEKHLDFSHTLIVCGTGNNGGDGLAIARMLYLKGHRVTTVLLGNEAHCTEETKTQKMILENYGVSVLNTLEKGEYSVIIDAMFGIGLSRAIEGMYRDQIVSLNKMSGVKVAVDIPSGISATTGQVLGVAFLADMTVTFACEKMGMVLYPGCCYTGEVSVVDIGIPSAIFQAEMDVAYTYEKTDIGRLLPQRKVQSHKGTYGKVLMIVGSEGMAGAAFLSAKAAYSVGAGLVKIYTPKENNYILQQLLPEAIVVGYEEFCMAQLQELLDWADVMAIGSGMGTGETAESILCYVITHMKKTCVVDADGLNILAKHLEMLPTVNQFILTPHVKELARLLALETESVVSRRMELVTQFVEKYPVVCVSKDARTFVKKAEERMFINTTGNSSMAKAGSGDVLTGMITGLSAQGMQPYEAGTLGVYLHGCAGDEAKREKGSYSVSAQDLISAVGTVIKEHEEVTKFENI